MAKSIKKFQRIYYKIVVSRWTKSVRPLIAEGGAWFAGSACDGCKNLPDQWLITVTKRYGPLFLHRKADRKSRLKESPARRVLGTFDRSKVSGKDSNDI